MLIYSLSESESLSVYDEEQKYIEHTQAGFLVLCDVK